MIKFDAKVGQAVHILWIDSASVGHGWVYEQSKLKAITKETETMGFVYDLTSEAVLIAATHSSSGGAVCPISIPLGCIKSVKIIDL